MMTVYIVGRLFATLVSTCHPKIPLDVPLIAVEVLFVSPKLWCSVYCHIADYTFAVTTVFEYRFVDAIWNAR